MEFTGQKSVIVPEGVFIIGTYDENGVPNAMNAAWGQQSDYGEITLFLAQHKTTENIKKIITAHYHCQVSLSTSSRNRSPI